MAAFGASFSEGFENSPIPNSDWDVYNTSGGANWEQSFDASYSGSFSAKLSAINNTRLSVSSMVSPVINISALSAPVLVFKLAAAESNTTHINNLKVLASTDCENTWTQIYSKTGQSLVTTNSNMNPFFPSSQSEWRTETVSLSSVSGSTHVKFKFQYSRDTIGGANNTFIDDINLSNFTGINSISENVSYHLFPNPANATVTLQLGKNNPVNIFITDVLGQLIETVGEKTDNYTFAVGRDTKFRPGIYFININDQNRLVTIKLIVN